MPKTLAVVAHPGRRLLYGTAVGLVFSLAGGSASRADCQPAPTGGPDTIICDATGGANGALNGAGGNDVISVVANGVINGDLSGGPDNDTLDVSFGTVNGNVNGNGGLDTITIGGGADVVTVTGDVNGGAGFDVITVGSNGGVGGNLIGENGDERFLLSGGSVAGNVQGDSGSDTFTLSGTSVTGDLLGGSGNDSFLISGGLADEVIGGGGDDTVGMSGGTVALLGGANGNDTIYMTGGTASEVSGAGGDDTLDIGGTATVLAGVGSGSGSDRIIVRDTASVTGNLGGLEGDDSFELTGGSVTGDAVGATGADIFTLNGTSVTGNLLGESGDDIFSILSGTADEVIGGGGDDTIAMSGGTVNRLGGAGGDDTVTVTGGSVDAQVSGSGGDDTLEISGTAIVAEVGTGSGNDRVLIDGNAVVTGAVFGLSGNDSVDLAGGSLDAVLGGTGDDLVRVSGNSTVTSDLLGGSGSDTFFLTSATSVGGVVSGDEGDDSLYISGAGNGGNFDGAVLLGIDTLAGGDGVGDEIEFIGVNGTLPVSLQGFEFVSLLGNTTLDLHNPASDDRGISGSVDVEFLIEAGSAAFADGNGTPGTFTLAGALENNGLFSMEDGAADDLAVVSTVAVGSGTLGFDAALDATAIGDLLRVASLAGVQGGTQAVTVNDVGTGAGVLTGTGPGNGIALIDVSISGVTDGDDFFLLGGPLQAGAVEYDLVLESDGIWYLQSSLLSQVFGYAAAPSAALAMGQDYLGLLRERVGTREQTWTGGAVQSSEGSGVWLRGGGSFDQVEDANGYDYDQDHWFAQAGADVPLLLDPNGPRLIGGLFAQYGTSNVDAKDGTGADVASIKLDAWGGGLSLTWYGSPTGSEGQGLYADLVGQVSVYDAEMRSGDATGDTDGWGWGVSLEAGWGFEVAENLRLIPQTRIAYSRVSLDGFRDSDGVEVDYGDADSLEGRVGFAVDSGRLWRSGNITFDAAVVHEFLGESDAEASGLDIGTDLGGTAAEVGLGGTVSLLDNISVYADVDYRIPFDDGRQGVSANLGVRVSW